jgi:MFS family permease
MSSLTPLAAAMPPDTTSRAVPETTRKAPSSAWYALAVLVIATVLGSIDKVILTLLTEPMRIALSLSDTQLGLLQGAGIVLFTGIATLPLGWLSDRYDRRVVLAACVVLWSAATAMRGTAMDYGVLFIASIGLGVGEAGLGPITNSMIPDLFPRAQRVLANAVFALSAIFGSALGALLGGTVVHLTEDLRPFLPASMQQMEAWRLTFFVLASAGLPVALLVLSIRRTRRGSARRMQWRWLPQFRWRTRPRPPHCPHPPCACMQPMRTMRPATSASATTCASTGAPSPAWWSARAWRASA